MSGGTGVLFSITLWGFLGSLRGDDLLLTHGWATFDHAYMNRCPVLDHVFARRALFSISSPLTRLIYAIGCSILDHPKARSWSKLDHRQGFCRTISVLKRLFRKTWSKIAQPEIVRSRSRNQKRPVVVFDRLQWGLLACMVLFGGALPFLTIRRPSMKQRSPTGWISTSPATIAGKTETDGWGCSGYASFRISE